MGASFALGFYSSVQSKEEQEAEIESCTLNYEYLRIVYN